MEEITTLEQLREIMYRRGVPKHSTETRAVAAAFDIMANCGHINADIAAAESTLREVQKKIEGENRRYEHQQKKREREYLEARKEYEAFYKDREAFYSELATLETSEARDAFKMAKWFKESVNPETKYDNTAYINAIGAILSRGKYDASEELQKINPKLFEK